MAYTGSVTIVCDKEKLTDDEVATCTIKGITSDPVSSLSMKLGAGENLAISNLSIDQSWEGTGENNDIEIYTDENKTDTFIIGTFNVAIGSDIGDKESYIEAKNIIFYDQDFEEHSVENSKVVLSYIRNTRKEEYKPSPDKKTNPTTGSTIGLSLIVLVLPD